MLIILEVAFAWVESYVFQQSPVSLKLGTSATETCPGWSYLNSFVCLRCQHSTVLLVCGKYINPAKLQSLGKENPLQGTAGDSAMRQCTYFFLWELTLCNETGSTSRFLSGYNMKLIMTRVIIKQWQVTEVWRKTWKKRLKGGNVY